MAKPILYTYFRSSTSWRVRVALAHKGIEYDQRPVNLIKDGGQQHTEDYKSLNPLRQVPSLDIDGVVLTQSLPIIEYLEETRPGKKLLPTDPVKKAQVRRVSEIINSGIHPIQNLSVITEIAKWTGDDTKKAEWAHYWIDRGFQALEAVLETTAGKFCVGDDVSMADMCLVPQVYNANRFKVDMAKYPIIARVNSACEKLQSFKEADPLNQPDCPESLKA